MSGTTNEEHWTTIAADLPDGGRFIVECYSDGVNPPEWSAWWSGRGMDDTVAITVEVGHDGEEQQ